MTNDPSPPRRSRTRYLLFSLLALAPTLVTAIVFSDMILQWFDLRSAGRRDVTQAQLRSADFTRRVLIETPYGLRLRQFLNERVVNPISHRETTIRTNALGFRGPEVRPKEPDEFRVLVLGDSITLGAYVEEEETYPAYLKEALARRRPKVSVINAGVLGLSTREELIILNQTGLLTQPDVVLVGMYLNDALASRTVPIPEGLAAHSAIARRVRDLRLADEVRQEARAEYERLSSRPFPTATFPEGAWRKDRAAFEVEIAKSARDWGAGWFAWTWSEIRRDLEVMQDLAGHYHFELVVALFPTTLQVEAEFLDDRPQQMFKQLMTELRLRHVDLLPVVRSAYQAAGHSLAYDQCHLTPEGNRIVAGAMTALVLPEH